jgi:tetratricopeptide (TPR) repeat protein
MVYITKQNYDDAIRMFEKALNLQTLFKYQKGIAETHFNIGNVYVYKNDLENAKIHLHKSKELFQKIKSSRDIFYVNLALGNIYLSNDREKAFFFFKECTEYDLYYENSSLLYTLSDLYREKENYKKTIEVKSLLLKNKKLIKKDLCLTHKEIATDYSKINNIAKAKFHFNKAISLSDDRKERVSIRSEIDLLKSK